MISCYSPKGQGIFFFFLQFYDPCPAFIEGALYIQNCIFQTYTSFEHSSLKIIGNILHVPFYIGEEKF